MYVYMYMYTYMNMYMYMYVYYGITSYTKQPGKTMAQDSLSEEEEDLCCIG